MKTSLIHSSKTNLMKRLILLFLVFLINLACFSQLPDFIINPHTGKIDYIGSSGSTCPCVWDTLGGNIYYDGGGFVGIGVINPLYALHVDGDVYCDTVRATHYGGHSNFTIGDSQFLMFMDGEMLMQNLSPSTSDTSIVIDNDTVKYRIDVVPWTSSGTYVYQSTLTDYVGIGTNTPAVEFDVEGSGKFSDNLTVEDTLFANTGITYLNGTTLITSPYKTASVVELLTGPRVYSTSGTNNFFALSSAGQYVHAGGTGNIGIGYRALKRVNASDHNIALGAYTFSEAISPNQSIAFGYMAFSSPKSGLAHSFAVGDHAGYDNQGDYVYCFGKDAGYNNKVDSVMIFGFSQLDSLLYLDFKVGSRRAIIDGDIQAKALITASDTNVTAVTGKIVFQSVDSTFYGCRSALANKKWYKLHN